MAPATIKGYDYADYVVIICARADLFNFKRAWNTENSSENILKDKDDRVICASNLDLTLYNCHWYRGNGEQCCEESRFVSTVPCRHSRRFTNQIVEEEDVSTRSKQSGVVA